MEVKKENESKKNSRSISKGKINDIVDIKVIRYALYFGGGLLILFLGGKVMRVLAGTVSDYKVLKDALGSK